MTILEYRDLFNKYLDGELSAESFVLQFNDEFLDESDDSLDDEAFQILQNLYEDGEAYSPLWIAADENGFRITEETLRKEVEQAKRDLDIYLNTHDH
jgi:hypothetical protein